MYFVFGAFLLDDNLLQNGSNQIGIDAVPEAQLPIQRLPDFFHIHSGIPLPLLLRLDGGKLDFQFPELPVEGKKFLCRTGREAYRRRRQAISSKECQRGHGLTMK